MTAQDLLDRLGLGGRADLRPFVHEQIQLRAVPAVLDDLPVGASRFGGPPDLPADVPWPRSPSGRPLPMLLQLRLADLAGCPAAARLPATGVLIFFATQNEDHASDPYASAAAIIHVADERRLERQLLPLDAADEGYWEPIQIARVDVAPGVATDDDDVLDANGQAALDALGADTRAAWAAARQPDETEGTPHLVFPVRHLSSAFGVDPPVDGVGVLELRSDLDIGMSWGDAAWITFAVPADDLAAGRFDRAHAKVWIG